MKIIINENNNKYKGGFSIYQKMLKESQRLDKLIKQLRHEIEKLPDGKLISGSNGKYHQWFQSDGHFRKYLPKKKKKLIEELAIKKYLSYQLEDYENERRAMEYYLKHHREDVGKAENLLTNKSEYRELLSPYFKTKSKELQDWMQEPFEKNSQYNENLILKTISGNKVRSKSEVIIDTLLFINQIHYRYECVLKIGKKKYYPDFTIKHPKTGKIYYWEHFGKMGDENYIRKTCSKLQTYALHGIIPSINLITTFETPEHPLSTEVVMKVLEEYFGVEPNQELMKMQFGVQEEND